MQHLVCSCISASVEYKQNHSSGSELSLKRKERKGLFFSNPNELHVTNKYEQVPYSPQLHKTAFVRKTTHTSLPTLYLPIMYDISIFDKAGAK